MNKKTIIAKIFCCLFAVVALVACDKEPIDNGKTIPKEEKETPKEINDNTLYELPVVFHVLSNSTTSKNTFQTMLICAVFFSMLMNFMQAEFMDPVPIFV